MRVEGMPESPERTAKRLGLSKAVVDSLRRLLGMGPKKKTAPKKVRQLLDLLHGGHQEVWVFWEDTVKPTKNVRSAAEWHCHVTGTRTFDRHSLSAFTGVPVEVLMSDDLKLLLPYGIRLAR
jgi:hypothetical protein